MPGLCLGCGMGSSDTSTSAPTRGPWSYLAWLVVEQRTRVALGAALSTAWMVGLALPPYVLSRAVDHLVTDTRDAVVWWSVALVAVGIMLAWLGIWRHRTMTRVRMDAAFRTVSVVNAHAVHLGATPTQRSRTGEVLTIGIGDAWTIGRSLTVTGPGVGAVLAYVVIAVLLFRVSVLLAVVVLAGVLVLALILGPALGRLQNVGASYRSQQGILTGRIVDIIGGLGVLNGLGGKDVYAKRFRDESQRLQVTGYRVGRITSLIQAVGLGLPPLFLAVVVWLAARLAAGGAITIGELVAVYGYTAVLVVPVSSFIESAVDINHALVAARRVTDFLALPRDADAGDPLPAVGDVVDTASGIRVATGEFTAVAAARQADAVALVNRLGGFGSGATWNGQLLRHMDPAALREHVLVADNDADLFAGRLIDVVAGRFEVDEARVLTALHTAAAEDVVRGLPNGLASRIDSGGGNLSGGQRQRVRLARALHADPAVLLAVDPTSAVDAATEATIINRLVRARHGRTTLVASTSALILAEADTVHLLAGDRLVASGTHTSLLRDEPAYAALVLGGETPDSARGQERSSS